MPNTAAARFMMVNGQIRPNRVTDSGVLDAMGEVPREQFVPKALRGVAYLDRSLAVGTGRLLMEPLTLARLLQAALITKEDVVLDVACATGYTTAVLARLAATVVAIDSDIELVASATRTLATLGIDNALVFEAPLTTGYPSQAPYNVMVINGAVAEVPDGLLDQLAEGGRLVAVIAPEDGLGQATLFVRLNGVISTRPLFETKLAMLQEFAPKPKFQL
ncbi:protein-L-isoaspartate(D-aspartate) O-methyltransferase [uncultured Gammaproteobacteria bacterium]